MEHLAGVRDRVLAHAEPLDGATVLDVGTGDGLIGLEALERVGASGRVIFSDISAGAAGERPRGRRGRVMPWTAARFVEARAEDLAQIADASVDVATTRSVLIYVADKPQAFSTLHRVLRPGGRISLFEPINRRMFPEPADRLWGYDVGAIVDLADEVKASYMATRDPAADSMMDFDEHDLVRFAENAGFEQLHLECHVDIEPAAQMRAMDLQTLLDIAPNPLAPSLREVLDAALGAAERDRFLAYFERVVAEEMPIRRSAVAYLVARKGG